MNILKILNTIRLSGGVTYNLSTEEINPSHGFMVSIPAYEKVVDSIDEDVIREFVIKNYQILHRKGMYFGVWFDGFYWVLDVSELFEHRRDAVYNAILRRQRAIWDNENQNEFLIRLKNDESEIAPATGIQSNTCK